MVADDALTRDSRRVKALRVHPRTSAQFVREQVEGRAFYGALFVNGVPLIDDADVPVGTVTVEYDPPEAALASRWSPFYDLAQVAV